MKMKRWVMFVMTVVAACFIGFYSIFTIPNKPQIISIEQHQSHSDWYCHQDQTNRLPIDEAGNLNLLVWNIHKQNDEGWEQALATFSQHRQLILLQEASLTEALTDWVAKQDWGASYVNAFKAFGVSAGVLNLASQLPNQACAYTQVEPWLQLPKSALYARYSLSNGQDLVVLNIHAINFTVGTIDFQQQIGQLKKAVQSHQGPLLLAGDFNTWSQARLDKLYQIAQSLGLQEVKFTPDHRKTFLNGLPFDHVFYRGLQLIQAQAPSTEASDHNPMLISFQLESPH